MWPFVFVKLYWTTSPLVVIWWSLIVCFCVILTVTHSCIIATVQLHHPDGREAINRYIDWKCLRIYSLLSTRADRQGVDISVTACVLVFCTVTVFSAENKASGVKFCMAVHRRPRLGISHFCELCSPEAQNLTNRPAPEGRWMFQLVTPRRDVGTLDSAVCDAFRLLWLTCLSSSHGLCT